MAYPAREGKFTLTVDAAVGDASHAGGLGACLFQQQPDGTKRPVGFASRQLLKYEANYPPFLLELAGAVFGMDYFHHYLVGRRFELLTDHKPLVGLGSIQLTSHPTPSSRHKRKTLYAKTFSNVSGGNQSGQKDTKSLDCDTQ